MEVNMKVAFLCGFLLLAGCAAASPVEANSITLPDWLPEIPDWIVELISNVPETIQTIIDKLPDIIAAIPQVLEHVKEIVLAIIAKIPEVIPVIIEKIVEILQKIPALIQKIREILGTIIEKIPELIPVILDKIPEILEKIPEAVDQIKELLKKIKEVLQGLDLPDWFPDLEKPEWWPDELPKLPEYNFATPGNSVTVQDYPMVAQIEVGTGPVWSQGCTGTVLNSLYILSSARCFSGRLYSNRFRRVRAGSSTRYNGGLIASVANANNHPDFDGTQADLTVVRLASNLVLGGTIAQAQILPQDFVLPAGLPFTLLSWGKAAQGKPISNRNLYAVSLVSTTNEECSDRWRLIPFVAVTNNNICLKDPAHAGRNSGIRDLGAPALYDNIVSGIVTLGVPFGNQEFPIITTAIAPYSNWIVANAV